MKKHILILFSFCILYSCSSNYDDIIEKSPDKTTTQRNRKIRSRAEAITEARNFILNVSEKTTLNLRSNNKNTKYLEIENVEILGSIKDQTSLRNSENKLPNDSLLYVINYKGDNGFVLISARRNTPPVYGWVKGNTLNLSDTTGIHPAIEKYIEDALYDIKNSDDTDFTSIDISKIDYKKYISPLLKVKWDQGSPYDKETPIINGRHTSVGCVAVAVGQILTHLNKDKTENFKTYKNEILNIDWNKLILNTKDYFSSINNPVEARVAANVLRTIGERVNMKYNLPENGGSGASSDKALQYIRNLGFFVGSSGYINTTKMHKMILALNNNYIIYVDGYRDRNRKWFSHEYRNGHAWVIDGYISYDTEIENECEERFEECDETDPFITITTAYFHNNFGWGGYRDGYFLLSNFALKNIPYDKKLRAVIIGKEKFNYD